MYRQQQQAVQVPLQVPQEGERLTFLQIRFRNPTWGVCLLHKWLWPREPSLVCHRPQWQGGAGDSPSWRSFCNVFAMCCILQPISTKYFSDWVCLLSLLLPGRHPDNTISPHRIRLNCLARFYLCHIDKVKDILTFDNVNGLASTPPPGLHLYLSEVSRHLSFFFI